VLTGLSGDASAATRSTQTGPVAPSVPAPLSPAVLTATSLATLVDVKFAIEADPSPIQLDDGILLDATGTASPSGASLLLAPDASSISGNADVTGSLAPVAKPAKSSTSATLAQALTERDTTTDLTAKTNLEALSPLPASLISEQSEPDRTDTGSEVAVDDASRSTAEPKSDPTILVEAAGLVPSPAFVTLSAPEPAPTPISDSAVAVTASGSASGTAIASADDLNSSVGTQVLIGSAGQDELGTSNAISVSEANSDTAGPSSAKASNGLPVAEKIARSESGVSEQVKAAAPPLVQGEVSGATRRPDTGSTSTIGLPREIIKVSGRTELFDEDTDGDVSTAVDSVSATTTDDVVAKDPTPAKSATAGPTLEGPGKQSGSANLPPTKLTPPLPTASAATAPPTANPATTPVPEAVADEVQVLEGPVLEGNAEAGPKGRKTLSSANAGSSRSVQIAGSEVTEASSNPDAAKSEPTQAPAQSLADRSLAGSNLDDELKLQSSRQGTREASDRSGTDRDGPNLAGTAALSAGTGAAVPGQTSTVSTATAHTIAKLSSDLAAKLASKDSRFDIELEPYGLGKVQVQVRIGQDGQLSAAMNFDNAQSAQEVKARAEELRSALQTAGFDLPGNALSFDVNDRGGGRSGANPDLGGQRQQSNPGAQDAFQSALLAARQTDTDSMNFAYRQSARTSGLDIRI